MGRYEDLLAQARSGDTAALDDLEKEFSGSALRSKAEEADTLRRQLDDNQSDAVAGRFARLVQEAGELDAPVSLEDLGEVSVEDITVDLLREKACEKAASTLRMKEAAAKDAGFETVEAYEQALASLKQTRSATADGMKSIGGATASVSGGTPAPKEETTPYDDAVRDFKDAKSQGATDDVAMGEAAHTLMARQAHAQIEGQ